MKDAQETIVGKVCPTCDKHFDGQDDVTLCPDDKTLLSIVRKDPLIGTIVSDRYEVLDQVGSGGFSKVYKATQNNLNRTVALKVLHAHLVEESEKVKRFQQEAEATSRLEHPHIASVFDYGLLPNGQPYLVMEFVDGVTLSKELGNGALALDRGVEVFKQATRALVAAHAMGIVHRDLKPGNLILTKTVEGETVKVLDFGLAKLVENTSPERLTQTGEALGTPAYMSPEQCTGNAVDARSDIYSFGCLMYECMTGKLPFEGKTSFEIMTGHMNLSPTPPSNLNESIPDQLEEVILTCLAKSRDDRFQSMSDLLHALESVPLKSPGKRPKARKKRLKRPIKLQPFDVAILALVALIGVVVAVNVIPKLMPGGAVMSAHPLDPAMTKQVSEFMQARNTSFEKAEDLGIRLVETTEKRYGAQSYENGAANFLLGALYRDYGQYRKAEPFLRKALDMKEATLGLSNPETAGALKEMGDFYLHLKRYDEAAEIYGKAVKSTEVLAPGQPPLAVALHGLAKAETGRGNLTQAKELYARAQKIMQNSAAGNQIGLSQTALMEVEAALSTGDNDKARQVIDDALTKNLSMEEELSFLTAKFQLERRQNNLPAAEKLGREALKLSQAVYGAANPITGTTSHELAKVLALQGKTSEAKLMFGKASDQAEKLYGKESIIYKTIQADVQRLERM